MSRVVEEYVYRRGAGAERVCAQGGYQTDFATKGAVSVQAQHDLDGVTGEKSIEIVQLIEDEDQDFQRRKITINGGSYIR